MRLPVAPRALVPFAALAASLVVVPLAGAQQAAVAPAAAPAPLPADSGALAIDRIFRGHDFDDAAVPDMVWLGDGSAWLEVRPAQGGGSDVVRVDPASGRATVVAPAARLAVDGKPLEIDGVAVSGDGRVLLLATGTRPYVPHKTGATYYTFEVPSGRLAPVSTKPGLQLVPKLSPDGRRVGFVRDGNLFTSDVGTGGERMLTTDGSDTILNGISDWVYHEELDIEDAWRWSPDGKWIAYLRFDQSAVPVYPMLDYTQLYPTVFPLHHPKPGQPNATVSVHVVNITGSEFGFEHRAIVLPPAEYIPRLEWFGTDSLAVTTMPRRQDRYDVRIVSIEHRMRPDSGRTLVSERDSLFVDVQDPVWIDNGRRFLLLSDRSGWRQLYLYERDGRLVRRVTADGTDVTAFLGVDELRGEAYVQLAEPDPTQRRVWRFPLAGGAGTRLSGTQGSDTWTIAPGARWAVSSASRLSEPPVVRLVEPATRRTVRTLVDNAALRRTLAAAGARAPQFFRVPMPDGTLLDAWRITPPGFDSTRAYPVLMYVYGGPATPTVVDAWGDKRYLFHQALAQRGYVVVSVDNRSAAWRGRAWRKAAYLRLGTVESNDQMDAARWLGKQSWVDAKRIGVWGRSFGGFMTALETGRGGDLFRMGMAIVPVTDWRFYDTIYTERYMRTPEENPDGYRETAPLTHVNGVSARLLLVTSTGDDNVHAQNALVYADRLTAANKPYEMQLFVNRPHPLSGGNTRASWYGTMYRYVLEHL